MKRKKMKLLRSLTLFLIIGFQPIANAEWQADPDDKRQVKAARAIENIKAKVERSHPFFEDAYAYAIWPGITRVAIGFGGAYGKGLVVEQDKAVGTVSYWQFSSGIQAGAKNFSMIVFFKDKESLESLQRGEMQFAGQAGIDVLTMGAHGTPSYSAGVAIIPLTKLGLMAEFSASGVKYNYKPYSK
jgi:lipid-binding SYLF domain-containing protein